MKEVPEIIKKQTMHTFESLNIVLTRMAIRLEYYWIFW